MIDSLAAAIVVCAIVAAIAVLARAAWRRYRWHTAAPMLIGFEVLALLQAAFVVGSLLAGHHAREPATLLGYLVISALVLPAVAVQARDDDGGWASLLVAAALLVLAVVTVRAQTTWRSA